ncbi:MAG: ABC transporter permease, partial [Acidimicrobiia bacterium]|nr:ABC transporter permease [Acidimicrobiia bacterium]
MRVALLELRRKPGRFAVVAVALVLLSLLLLFLGALLDGLFLNSTGAIRSVDADGIVFSADARQSFLRSSIDDATRQSIESVDGVGETGGLGISLLGVTIPGEDDVADGAVAGYELGSSSLPAPPPPGDAYADRRLEEFGAEVGQTLLIGPAEVPLRIIGWVDDTNYLLQNGLWVEPDTWRQVQNQNRPDAPVVPG